jgi:hypothetical protein
VEAVPLTHSKRVEKLSPLSASKKLKSWAGACQWFECAFKAGALDSDLTRLALQIGFELPSTQALDPGISGDAR